MAGKIFYRERVQLEDGAQQPRFRVVAISDCDLKFFIDHVRLSELEHIADETGVELVLLRKGEQPRKRKTQRKGTKKA